MSRFSEVIVLARGAEAVMEPLTVSDVDRGWPQRFTRVDDAVFGGRGGGSSECYAWVIQFERAVWGGIFAALESLDWPDPWSVQVLIRDEEDSCFGLWMLYDGRLTEVSIPRTVREPFPIASVTGILHRTDRPGFVE